VKGSITTAKVSVPSADDVPVRTSARYRTGEKADSKLLQSKRDCEFFSIVQISLQLRAVPSRVSWSAQPPGVPLISKLRLQSMESVRGRNRTTSALHPVQNTILDRLTHSLPRSDRTTPASILVPASLSSSSSKKEL